MGVWCMAPPSVTSKRLRETGWRGNLCAALQTPEGHLHVQITISTKLIHPCHKLISSAHFSFAPSFGHNVVHVVVQPPLPCAVFICKPPEMRLLSVKKYQGSSDMHIIVHWARATVTPTTHANVQDSKSPLRTDVLHSP